MPRDIYQVATNSIEMNERLRSFDVNHQQSERSCLGTASHLETDAVRLVLTNHERHAEKCFETVIAMAEAAIAGGETWVYDTSEIAAFFAYRLAFIAAWAVRPSLAPMYADRALNSFESIAHPHDYQIEHPNQALAATLLLSVHGGQPQRLASRLAMRRACALGHGWCRCFELVFAVARGLDVTSQIETFFERYVRAQDRFSVVAEDFPVSSAISFAYLRSVAREEPATPFEVIASLLSPAA